MAATGLRVRSSCCDCSEASLRKEGEAGNAETEDGEGDYVSVASGEDSGASNGKGKGEACGEGNCAVGLISTLSIAV